MKSQFSIIQWWSGNFRFVCVCAMSLSIARDRNHKNVICLNSDDFSRHLIGPPPLLKIDAEQSKSVIFLFLLFGCHQKWDTEHTARHENTVIKFYFASMAEKSAHFGIQASFFFITRNLFRNEHKQKMSTFYFFLTITPSAFLNVHGFVLLLLQRFNLFATIFYSSSSVYIQSQQFM